MGAAGDRSQVRQFQAARFAAGGPASRLPVRRARVGVTRDRRERQCGAVLNGETRAVNIHQRSQIRGRASHQGERASLKPVQGSQIEMGVQHGKGASVGDLKSRERQIRVTDHDVAVNQPLQTYGRKCFRIVQGQSYAAEGGQ